MLRGANVLLDVHIVLVLVLVQQVGAGLRPALQLLRVLLVHFALARVLRGPGVRVTRMFPIVLCLPQLFLVLHPPILKPRFHLYMR